MRDHWRRLAATAGAMAAIAGLAAACAAPRSASQPSAADRSPPERAQSARARPSPDLCAELSDILGEAEEGFARLRAGPRGESSSLAGGSVWAGDATLEGFGACRVEGERAPSARYVCYGASTPEPEALSADFEATASAVRACLSDASRWPRRLWREADAFEFAGGETQLFWRDIAIRPELSVALKIEEDFATELFRLRLDFSWLR